MKLRLRWHPDNHHRGVYFDIDLERDDCQQGPGWFTSYGADPWGTVVNLVRAERIVDGDWVYDPKSREWVNQARASLPVAPRRNR